MASARATVSSKANASASENVAAVIVVGKLTLVFVAQGASSQGASWTATVF